MLRRGHGLHAVEALWHAGHGGGGGEGFCGAIAGDGGETGVGPHSGGEGVAAPEGVGFPADAGEGDEKVRSAADNGGDGEGALVQLRIQEPDAVKSRWIIRLVRVGKDDWQADISAQAQVRPVL